MINVLIISGGSFQGSTLIKGLKCSSQVRIHLADCYPENINKYECEVFHEVPFIRQNDDFLNTIQRIVAEEGIDIVFPSTDYELELLSNNKKRIESAGARLSISDPALNNVLINKIRTFDYLKRHGFPLLKAIDIHHSVTEYPIIGKPASGFGGKGLVVLKNQSERNQALQTIDVENYLWMPFIDEFEEFSVDFAISFKGEISPIVIRKRIRTAGGFAVIAQYAIDETIRRQVSRLADTLKDDGGYGIFNVQVIKYNNDSYTFSDINPRVGTSSVFTIGMGVNLPLFMCSSLLACFKNDSEGTKTCKNAKMVRNLSEKWLRIMSKEEVEGVVFDLDDTLIDQKLWIFDKLSLVYAKHAEQLPGKEIFMFAACHFIEEGKRSTLFDELQHKFNLSDRLHSELIESFRQAQPESIRVFRDVADNLARLKRFGLKIGLLTDNPVRSQQQKIKMLPFNNLFDAIVFSMATGREKPDKLPFEKIASEIGVKTDKLVMVGDNLYRDCYGAINANYQSAFFIERQGTFFNFQYQYLLNSFHLPAEKIVRITSFNELYYSIAESVV